MTLVLRFIDTNGDIHEEFIKFILCENGVSGEAIADSIIMEIRELGLDMENCRGQGYDGQGIWQGNIKEEQLVSEGNMTFHLCSLHQLNPCIVSSCEILLVKKMMDHVKAVADFFNNSSK